MFILSIDCLIGDRRLLGLYTFPERVYEDLIADKNDVYANQVKWDPWRVRREEECV